MRVRVLFLDDDVALLRTAQRALRAHEIDVDGYDNAERFLRVARARQHDVLLIDWNLRFCEGTKLCERMRSEGEDRPIAIISGKLDADHGHEIAITAGADAYVEKPAKIADLAREIAALAGREGKPACARYRRRLNGSIVTIELRNNKVVFSNLPVALRPKDRELLEALLHKHGRHASKAELGHDIWQLRAAPNTSVVETAISRLRTALGPAANLIETVDGGYVIRTIDR